MTQEAGSRRGAGSLPGPFAVPASFKQFYNWVFCQICGWCKAREEAKCDGWLISPYRPDRNVTVVRCYKHISEWSLRMSDAGRSDGWRRKMRSGKIRAFLDKYEDIVPELDPLKMPIPLRDVVLEDSDG